MSRTHQRPWRQLPMAIMLVVVNAVLIWVWIINVEPNKNIGFAGVLLLIWAIYLLEAAWIKLVVTPESVRVISAHRDPPISRDRIGCIRAMFNNTIFYDYDGKRILETHIDLSRTQLLALGSELGVNVWDHRAWCGLRELKRGVRLNPESLARRPSA